MDICAKRIGLVFVLVGTAAVSASRADWPMAGHDPSRSSWAAEDSIPGNVRPIWHRKIDPYIPNKVQIVTVKAAGAVPAMVLVSTARGVYALNPRDGSDLWYFATEMPVNHSPTVVGGVVYFSCTDKTVYAVQAGTGAKLWQSLQAGAAFDTSPVVVDGRVYLGCRDGHFYAFDARDGALVWHYEASGPISFSAAYADGVLYFACKHNYVYALSARDGKQLWKSEQLPGAGFMSWWPVVNGDRLLVPGTNNFGKGQGGPKMPEVAKSVFPADAREGQMIGPIDADGWIDARLIVEDLTRHPDRQTLHVLDRASGAVAEVAPVLFWGNPSDNRIPPVVGPDGLVYTSASWAYNSHFLQGRIAAWKMGTSLLKPFVSPTQGRESFDETDNYAMIGRNIITFNRGGDGSDGGGVWSRGGGSGTSWNADSLRRAFPDYAAGWEHWKYGNAPPKGAGTHGYQNPPVPLDGKIYFHRSNSVICFGP